MMSDCRKWFWVILGMICSVISWPACAQHNWQMNHLSTEDGLSQGMIYSILQDGDGFIWIGTKDGLNRYDGRTFKVFTNNPQDSTSISGNTVTLLYEDSKGYIWAVSENSGLNIYDKKTGIFHHIRHVQNLSGGITGNNVTAILEDQHGNYILSIAGIELNVLSLHDSFFSKGTKPDVRRIRMPPQQYYYPNQPFNIRNLYEDVNGDIWVVGDQYLYQLEVSTGHLQEKALTRSSFYYLYLQPDGSSWAFRRDGQLYYLNDRDTVNVGNLGIPLNSFIVDQGTSYLLFHDSLRYFDYNPIDNTISNYKSLGFGATVMIKDRSGLLWVGTRGYGLYTLNLNAKRFNHIARGISVAGIACINDEIIVKNFNPDWQTIDGKTFQSPAHIRSRYVANILPLSDHEIFYKYFIFETNQFVYEKIVDGEKSAFSFPSNLSQSFFDPVIQTRDGNIMAAGANNKLMVINTTNAGYSIYDLDYEVVMDGKEYYDQKPSRTVITTLFEDPGNTLWVGTDQGFMTINLIPGSAKLKVVRYQNDQLDNTSLSYNHVSCFLSDPLAPEKFMWVATKGGGLNKMDLETGTFIRYSKDNGLPDNVVYGVLADDNGNIWGSTNKGIFCMLPSEVGSNYTFRNFSKADGLQEEEFNTDAYLKLPDSRLAFGGVNGLNVFAPDQILQEGYEPPIYITDISVNNQSITPFDSTGILSHPPEYTSQLTLKPKHDILSIQYVSLDFRAPNNVQYRYQMKGLGDDWIYVGNQQSASFINMAPGNYEFRVQGTNSQNKWSDHIAIMKIRVLAPWYAGWWAYLLYGILILMVIWLYFRFSFNRAKLQQQLAFEKQEAERVRELDALKTQLFTNMTHEFRTPLTIIIGMAQQVLDNPKKHFNEGLSMIINNGQNLLGMVNKMLNLSKLESGKMTLDLVQSDIVSFLRNIVESFRSFAAKKEIQLHFLPEVDEVIMDFDPDKLQQIISNLISNAFKFTPDGGHIYFSIREENGSIKIRVKDTGRGIPVADQDKIFDRFYQTDNSNTRRYEGTGIGLALCKDLVVLMEGQISVQSPPVGTRKGAEFTVTLPIRQQALITEIKQHDYFKPLNSTQIEKEPHTNTASESAKTSVPIKEKQILPFKNAKKPLILLVEDNSDVVAYIAACLGDYRLAVAEDGQEGYEMAIDMIPDLIISDVMMPIMDGFELCRQLKSDERTGHIPVIILTARADMDSKIEGLELGANAYLPKPFEKQELLLNIKNLFELRNKLRLYYQNLAGLVESPVTKDDLPETTKSEDAFVIKVSEIIEVHISDYNLTVEQLARELHLSHSQFSRKLDALTGFTPNRFIRNIRLKKAKELLRNQELSITAIAYDCGFNDPSYFTRVFKKEFEVTPVEWRSEV